MVQIKPLESRVVFHIDMDAFFASVEVARNPSLKGKPVIVGGQPNTRGVVSTCSYEARKFGVHSAMSLTEAYRRCPHGIYLDGNFSLYREYSQLIMELFRAYTPHVEVVSVDEAYLDVTETSQEYPCPETLGTIIKKVVLEHTQLTCSIGIASNKLVAKIASSKNKPNGLFRVFPGHEEGFLEPLPIQALPGVGEKTQVILNRDGFKTIGDMQRWGMEELIHTYGSHGYHFFLASHGMDNRPVFEDDSPPKSVGADTTFDQDVKDPEFFRKTIIELVEKVGKRLRKHKMRAKAVSLKLRYSDFKTITRSRILFAQTNVDDEFAKALLVLLEKNYRTQDLALRMIGVSLEKLTDGYWQPTFWDK